MNGTAMYYRCQGSLVLSASREPAPPLGWPATDRCSAWNRPGARRPDQQVAAMERSMFDPANPLGTPGTDGTFPSSIKPARPSPSRAVSGAVCSHVAQKSTAVWSAATEIEGLVVKLASWLA